MNIDPNMSEQSWQTEKLGSQSTTIERTKKKQVQNPYSIRSGNRFHKNQPKIVVGKDIVVY